jgi:hypothetical protein
MRGSFRPKTSVRAKRARSSSIARRRKGAMPAEVSSSADTGASVFQSWPNAASRSMLSRLTSTSSKKPFSLLPAAGGIRFDPSSTPMTSRPCVIALVPLRCIPSTTTMRCFSADPEHDDDALLFGGRTIRRGILQLEPQIDTKSITDGLHHPAARAGGALFNQPCSCIPSGRRRCRRTSRRARRGARCRPDRTGAGSPRCGRP